MELDGYTIVDGVALLIVVISALLAFSRGLIREVMSILGWVVAAFAAFTFAPQVEPLVREIPIIKDFVTSCQLSTLAAFAAVFAIALVVVSIFTPLFSGLIANSALGPMDQGLGFLFGVARGVVLIAVALIVYDIAIGGGEGGFPQVEESKSRVLLADFKSTLEAQIPQDAPGWIAAQYEKLTGACTQ